MRGWRFWSILLGSMIVAIAVIKLQTTIAQARAGSAFAARMGCACVFIEQRSAESCRTDFEPGMELVSLHVDRATRTVSAGVPLMAKRSARFGAMGCVLD